MGTALGQRLCNGQNYAIVLSKFDLFMTSFANRAIYNAATMASVLSRSFSEPETLAVVL